MIRRPRLRRRRNPVPPAALSSDSGVAPLPTTVSGSSPRTITIVDDGLDSVVLGAADDTDGPAPARTSMDPRIRARRREVRRTQGRRRRRVLIAIASVLAVVVVALVLLVSPVLSVRRVDVDGDVYSRYFDGERLEEVVASLRGEPILSVDLDAARRQLEASPWIRAARVRRDLPGRVVIELDERRPIAWFTGADGEFRVIDAEGTVVAVLAGQPVDYPGIAGPAPDLLPGEVAPPAFQAAAQLVRALPQEVSVLLTGLEVGEAGDLSMNLSTDTEVRFGRPDDLQSKLVALVVVLRRNDAADLSVIDLSSGQPTVR